MKFNYKNVFNLIILISATMIIYGCSQEKEESTPEESKEEQTDMMTRLKSDNEITKEQPFQLRPFNPEHDGKPIYNAASYGFYREGQAPGQKGPSDEEIIEDLDIISKYWNLVRVYNADDDTERLLDIIKKNNYPVKVMFGIWLENEKNNPEKHEANLINLKRGVEIAEKYKDQIAAISVGNETQVYWSAHRMSIETLTKYIRFVRKNTSLPITTADDYQFWVADSSKELASEIDFITTHAHPAWNGLTVNNSINWLDSIYTSVKSTHTDKMVVIGETGWPTDYEETKVGDGQQGTLVKGKIGVDAQEKFYKLYNEWLSEKEIVCFLFEVFDEPWKGGGENTSDEEIEKNWGIYYEDRTPKKAANTF